MLILFIAPAGLFRDGVARLLGDLAECVEVKCADFASNVLDDERLADLVVLDGDSVPDALSVANASQRLQTGLPVLVLLTAVDPQTVEEFVAAGVAGHLDKSESGEALLDALRLLLAGSRYPASTPLVPDEAALPASANDVRASEALADEIKEHVLTPRQIQVLALAARGETNKSIAKQLNITEGTVKVHLYTVYKALKVGSRGQASVAAARLRQIGDAQLHRALDGQLSVGRLLAFTTPTRFKSGEVLFHKNDPSDALYYVVRGTVSLAEINIEVGRGAILGEIGLFSPDRRRTCTARCITDCELLMVSATDAMRLYYQDPEFATYLIHLITRRLEADTLRSKN
ncbi:cyclic nucleotide-binding domain-containing protein [Paraburkholderia sp. CNPSo 3157]|uniref:Cyclic nucleotide-binding domain-containing protein n=1 Tax=Paraburkholderia franconis TaxID=2654983 RepID=A0A7X1TIC8_9BURK|nr:LuxR C-terminal-related transcriptional regulator [Paraburkholderia franconis]MPW20261.1 cyclic nucleotide-binding domain-containing protein [Paraburkholderia franconis]